MRARSYHAVVSLPQCGALAVAQRTRPLIAVAAALAAVERHMVVGPGDAAREARAHVRAQLLDGQHVVVGRRRHIERAADAQVGPRRRHAQAVGSTIYI